MNHLSTAHLNLIFVLTLGLFCDLSAQSNAETDIFSLRSDTSLVKSLIKDAQIAFQDNKIDQAVSLAQKALDTAKENKLTNGQAQATLIIGKAYRQLQKYTEASEYLLQSIILFKKKPNKQRFHVEALMEMGFVNQEQEFHQSAIEYFNQAYNLNKEGKNPKINYIILESLVMSHLRMKKYKTAIHVNNILLGLHEKQADTSKISQILKKNRDILKLNKQYREAITWQEKILKLRTYDGIELAQSLNELGKLYQLSGDNNTALKYLYNSLSMIQYLNDPNRDSLIKKTNFEFLIDVGTIYTQIGKYNEARKYYTKALNFDRNENDPVGMARIYNCLAANSLAKGDLSVAKKHGQKAEQIAKKNQADIVLLNSYKVLAAIYQKSKEQKKYEKYADLYDNLNTKLENQQYQAQFDIFQDQIVIEKKENEFKLLLAEKEKQSLALRQSELERQKQVQDLKFKENEIALLKRNQELKESAFRNQQLEKERIQQILLITQQKSEASKQQQAINLLEKNKEIQELALKEKTAKEKQRQNEIKLLEKEKALQNLKDANFRRYSLMLFSLMALIMVLILIGFFQNKRKNRVLGKQKTEIQSKNEQLLASEEEIRQNLEELEATQENLAEKNEQLNFQNDKIKANALVLEKAYKQLRISKESLDQKNKELNYQNTQIRESLKYGHKIQIALLPQENQLQKIFPNSFIFYKPKDIVSGDFFWFHKIDEKLFVAVVDCTGHGVPGAFMSMIGNKLLLEIVEQKGILDPAAILEELHLGIVSGLRQDETGNQDGMDLTLCRLEKLANGHTRLRFAGAKHTLYVFDKQLIELKGTRKSIGGHSQNQQVKTFFSNHELVLNPQASLYCTSDGLLDSPNPKRRKFGPKRFRAFIEENYHYPLEQQKENLLSILEKFQEDTLQRDDILVLGLRV